MTVTCSELGTGASGGRPCFITPIGEGSTPFDRNRPGYSRLRSRLQIIPQEPVLRLCGLAPSILARGFFVRGCRDKLEFMFHFSGGDGLKPLPGGRGQVIFYSPQDYPVEPDRQILQGLRIREVVMNYRECESFVLRFTLARPADSGPDQLETYESTDISDSALVRHLGVRKWAAGPYSMVSML